MQRKISILFISLLLAQIISAQPGYYTPAGAYVGFSDQIISDLGSTFTNQLVNYVNNYGYPDISGSSGSTDYRFSSFNVAVDLDEFFFSQESDPTSFSIGWGNTQFKIQFNYHICVDTIFRPCEDGYIQVFTTTQNSSNAVTLATDLTLDYTTESPYINAEQTTLNFEQGLIEINVQCTNAICVIPVDDIANIIANDFVSTVTTGITNQLNTMLPNIYDRIDPFILFPNEVNGYSLELVCVGNLVQSTNSSGYTPQQTAQLQGTLLASQNGVVVQVPFNPAFTPDASVLQNLDAPLGFTLTPYLFQTIIYTGLAVELPLVVEPTEVPAASPVQLNTSDSFFSSVAPGLLQYPNLGLQLKLSSPSNIPTVTFNSTGMDAGFNITADFVILSQPPQYAFGVLMSLQLEIENDVTVLSSSSVELSSKILNIVPSTSIISSNVGDVDPTGFDQLVQMMEGLIKVPSFNLTLPAEIQVSDATIVYGDDYVQIPVVGTVSPSSFNNIFKN